MSAALLPTELRSFYIFLKINILSGVPGFEPGYDGIKTRCLTKLGYTPFIYYYGRRDLNSHIKYQNLNLVRLPISPLPFINY